MNIVIDLHGYPVWEALEVADKEIEKAWKQPDVESITLIHGAPDVYHHAVARQLGRGGIKWALRGRLAQGEWSNMVYGRRSKRHIIEDEAMTLALRPRK
jgi:hypothetical protein